MPHRGHQAAHRDGSPCAAAAFSPSAKPARTASTTLIERQVAVDVELWREPHLRIDHVVGGKILDTLESDSVQRFRRLHHRDGMGERFEVADQRTAVRRSAEPLGECRLVRRGQIAVTHLVGNLDDGRRPQSTVEMVVQ